MNITIINFIFQGVPEVAALIFTAFSILGLQVNIRKMLLYGFILTSLIWFIRVLEIPFGLHTLAALIGLAVIVYKQGKVTLGTSVYVGVITLFLLVCAETIVHLSYEKFFGNVLIEDVWLWVILGWPQIGILIGIAFVIQRVIRPIIMIKYNKKDCI